MPVRPLRRAGGVFRRFHEELVAPAVDFAALDVGAIPAELRPRVIATWQERVRSEYRSIQIMNRFLADVLAAGDPLDVYAGAVDLIRDEIRHVALCADLVTALGATPVLPEPVEVAQPAAFIKMPPADRALATAIAMLAVNETLSVGFVADLQSRCTTPVFRDVLDATLGDEEGHEAFGWQYIRESLQRFPIGSLPSWRKVASDAFEPHRKAADEILAKVPSDAQRLEAWEEPELVAFGLFSPQRQALVLRRTFESELRPRLQELQLG